MKPRYNPDTGYIECLTVFIPNRYSKEEWDAMSLEEREKEAEWWAYAFIPKDLSSYVRGEYQNSIIVNIYYETRTVQIKWEDMGNLLAEAKRHLIKS